MKRAENYVRKLLLSSAVSKGHSRIAASCIVAAAWNLAVAICECSMHNKQYMREHFRNCIIHLTVFQLAKLQCNISIPSAWKPELSSMLNTGQDLIFILPLARVNVLSKQHKS